MVHFLESNANFIGSFQPAFLERKLHLWYNINNASALGHFAYGIRRALPKASEPCGNKYETTKRYASNFPKRPIASR